MPLEDMEGVSVGECSVGSRKRPKNDSARKQEKKRRYLDKDAAMVHFVRPCAHDNKRFQCSSLGKTSLIKARKKLFEATSKIEQDNKVAQLLSVVSPKRRRARPGTVESKPKAFQVSYLIRTSSEEIPVCKAFFLKAFGLSATRVHTISKNLKFNKSNKENRGGDRRSSMLDPNRRSVKAFLAGLKAEESHYSRNKCKRMYLPATLNIRRLWKCYLEAYPLLPVKYHFFHKIFSESFNLGFGCPAVDVCSYCVRMKHQIKHVSENSNKKNRLLAELGIHRLRAKHFHRLMKEIPVKSQTLCFDLQQVQPLPKTPIGEAFYARQISFYAFCVTDILTSKPAFYTWTENQANRGCVEIGSALINYLTAFNFDEDCNTLRLFADGCGGQNKNSHIIHCLALWLLKTAPINIRDVLLVLPVRGHSYLPADRVFGQVERKLRVRADILLPTDYHEIYKEVGDVKILEDDWTIQDIKSLESTFKKVVGIRDVKRIMLRRQNFRSGKVRIMFKTCKTYRVDDPEIKFESLVKPKKNLSDDRLCVKEIPLKKPIADKKKADVKGLLAKMFGDDWRKDNALQWYCKVLDCNDVAEAIEENVDDPEEGCDCEENEPGIVTV